MKATLANVTPESGGTSVCKSTAGPPSSHKNQCVSLLQSIDETPTIWPCELIAFAMLHTSPATVPRLVITPFFQRNPKNAVEASSDWPTTSPASFIQIATEVEPPGKVPRFCSPRFLSQRKARML